MRSSILKQSVTIVLCLAFLMLVVPGSVNAEKKLNRSDVRVQLSKQISLLEALFPFLAGIVNIGLTGLSFNDAGHAGGAPSLSARPTGDLPPGKPSEGD
jgi:hypothetical protein